MAYGIGIPHHVFNFSDRFRQTVMERFVCAYEQGRTPNPCIDCNRFLKFEKLYLRAKELHCDYVATGHYAQIAYDDQRGRYLLKKAADESKDQSYVLYAMNQEQLAHTLFPLGGLSKSEARQIAADHGLATAAKHDSQDICFVPDGDYAAFIERHTQKTYPEGDFIDEEGRVLGRHKGIIRYTLGQRRGFGLSFDRPMYVKEIDVAANTVTLAPEGSLYSRALLARDINLISVSHLAEPMRVKAKVRYRQTEQWATARQIGEDLLEIVFDEPQRAVTCGQAVVLYDGDLVVGGGTIETVKKE